MTYAIIDDEPHCIESLALHMKDLFPEMELIYKTNKVQEAADALKENPADLLFLDIEMPGMNGFQFLEQFPDRSFDVIFTTAYSQYALKAFKAKAVDYLLKPIDEQELEEVVQSWKTQRESAGIQSENIDQLLDYLKKEGFMKSKISVPVSDGYEFVEVSTIVYCQSQSNYTTLFLNDGSKVLVSKTMKDVEETLSSFFFMRVHQSYLVNPNYMKKYFRHDGGYLLMQNDESIPVSKANRSKVINLFESIRRNI